MDSEDKKYFTAEEFDKMYDNIIKKEQGLDDESVNARKMFENAKKKSTIKAEDYIMEDGRPIVNIDIKSSDVTNDLARKAEMFMEEVPIKKGISKVKDFMMDEDVKDFNKVLAKITFEKEGIDKAVVDLFNDPTKVYNTLVKYFEVCINKNIMPTIATMCAFLGCSKEELYRNAGSTNCKSYKVLSKGIMLCHSFIEMGAINGVVDSRVFSFLSKNYYGLKDDTSVVVRAGVIDNNDVNNVETLDAIRRQVMYEEASNVNNENNVNDNNDNNVVIDMELE